MEPRTETDHDPSVRAPFTERVFAPFRDPATTFLIVASVVGVVLVFLVPRFGGIDEGGHFARAYQLSTGRLTPIEGPPGSAKGGGACLPVPVAAAMARDADRLAIALLPARYEPKLRAEIGAPDREVVQSLPDCGSGERFFSFASFAWYSPVAYLPQAAAIAVVRGVGGSVSGMLLAARIASLVAYVALAWFAIRRAPVGRWALCITALLPVALFQGATSLAPDAITTAMALVVVSSALRMTADPRPRLPRAFLVEATVLSLVLGLCKPSYVVVGLCYLLPLLGTRRRLSWWPLVIPVALGGAVSALWQNGQAHLFVCDTSLFGTKLNPSRQRHDIVANPLRLVGASCRAALDYGDKWAGDVVTVGQRVVDWPVVFAVVAVIGFLLLAIQRDPKERFALEWPQRGFVLVVFVAAYMAVIAGWIIYCESPPVGVGIAPHARLFMPALALVPVALEVTRGRLGRLSAAAVPITLVLVPFEIVWLISVGLQMR